MGHASISLCPNDLTLFERQLNTIKTDSTVNRRSVVINHPFHRVLDRSRENFTIWNVFLPTTGDRRHVLDRKTKIGSVPKNVNIISLLHESFQGVHRREIALVIEKAGIEIKILKRLCTHPCLLRHCGMRPAQDTPFCSLDPVIQNLTKILHRSAHLFGGNIACFGNIMRSTDRNISIHVLHLIKKMLGSRLILIIGRTHKHFTAQTI